MIIFEYQLPKYLEVMNEEYGMNKTMEELRADMKKFIETGLAVETNTILGKAYEFIEDEANSIRVPKWKVDKLLRMSNDYEYSLKLFVVLQRESDKNNQGGFNNITYKELTEMIGLDSNSNKDIIYITMTVNALEAYGFIKVKRDGQNISYIIV